MRPGSISLTPALITLLAVLAFLVVLNFAITKPETTNTNEATNGVPCTADAKLCPDGSSVGRTGSKCEFTPCPGESEIDSFAECEAAGYPVGESFPRQCFANRQTFVESVTNTNTANTNTATNTNSTNQNTNTTAETLPANVKRFTSQNLGITFTYYDTAVERATVQEIGDKVYIAVNLRADQPVTEGQWVQVISKDPADTLAQAIEKKYLQGYDPAKCFVKSIPATGFSSTMSLAIISFPYNTDGENPWWDGHSCPAQYSETNGARYFWMDSQHPGTLLFFSIGQYAISGNAYPVTSEQYGDWQKTMRITD